MPLTSRLTSLWRNLFHKDRVDQECSEEIQAYLDMLTEAKLKQGLSPREARRNALLEVGGVDQVEERVREIRMGRFIEPSGETFERACERWSIVQFSP